MESQAQGKTADPRARTGSSKKVRTKSTLREYAEAILIAVVLTLIIRTFIIQAFRIPTGSMESTLLIGDHLFVNKFLYGAKVPFTDITLPAVRDPQRGDIVVFKYPEDPSRDFIKRLVAVPGDTVQIIDKVLHINGVAQTEDYVQLTGSMRRETYRDPNVYPPGAGNRDNYGPVVVPENNYFMMGDNRDHSDDSRFWGFLERDLIKGKALFIYLSINKTEPWWKAIRFERFGKIIH
jgi:signal peptidase I